MHQTNDRQCFICKCLIALLDCMHGFFQHLIITVNDHNTGWLQIQVTSTNVLCQTIRYILDRKSSIFWIVSGNWNDNIDNIREAD